MATCRTCGAKASLFDMADGECPDCLRKDRLQREAAALKEAEESSALSEIILTTETAHDLPIARRLDIITAEVVIGMHLFKDIASTWRDVFGGRSQVMQTGLRDARKSALDELRREAASIGADAVVGVDLDYSEISGGGKSMLFLVASGTAVTLKTTSN